MKKHKLAVGVACLILLIVFYEIGNSSNREIRKNKEMSAEIKEYLESTGLNVYSGDDFTKRFGITLFQVKPKVTALKYVFMPIADVIGWYDGDKEYDYIGQMNVYANDNYRLESRFAYMCMEYDFDMYLAYLEDKTIAYAKNADDVAEYIKESQTSIDDIYTNMDDFILAVIEEK